MPSPVHFESWLHFVWVVSLAVLLLGLPSGLPFVVILFDSTVMLLPPAAAMGSIVINLTVILLPVAAMGLVVMNLTVMGSIAKMMAFGVCYFGFVI